MKIPDWKSLRDELPPVEYERTLLGGCRAVWFSERDLRDYLDEGWMEELPAP